MSRKINVNIGDKFGDFIYLGEAPRRQLLRQAPKRCFCKCKCGSVKDYNFFYIVNGRTSNCGCDRVFKNVENVVGKTYGSITIIEDLGRRVIRGEKFRYVLAKCCCGNIKEYRLSNVKTRKSCGCLTLSIIKSKGVTHGMSKSRMFSIWTNMKNRCSNPKLEVYKRYGGKGIRVCDEWFKSFEAFRDWAYQNNYSDTLTLDRYPNRNGNYEPSNCRWATNKQQQNNKNTNYYVSYKGEVFTITELCDKYNLVYTRVHARIMELGWDVDMAVETDKIENSIMIANALSHANKKGSKKASKLKQK